MLAVFERFAKARKYFEASSERVERPRVLDKPRGTSSTFAVRRLEVNRGLSALFPVFQQIVHPSNLYAHNVILSVQAPP